MSHIKLHYPKFSLMLVTLSVAALVPAAVSAAQPAAVKSIGFQIVDQPPVVIGGRSPSSAAAPVMVRGTPANLAAEPVVEGFADKVPLTVALQQILPQGYGYTLGDGIDPGQLVSWRGGKPWNTVLAEMLRSAGLSHSVNGRSVAVNGSGVAPTIIAGAPQAPAAVVMQPQAPQPVMMQPAPEQPVMLPPVQQPMAPQPMAVQQQPVMMQPQPMMVQQQPMMMQPAPEQQMVMMQQPVMMQPQPMMVSQQPMMMQPMPEQQMVMMQQPMPQQVAPQANAGPQPLQIENPAIFTPQAWEVKPGSMLRRVLADWCARVGAELQWNAEYDFPVMASMVMTGTFEEAVRTLLTGFNAVKPTPQARLHYNPAAGQSVLIVEVVGNHYGE